MSYNLMRFHNDSILHRQDVCEELKFSLIKQADRHVYNAYSKTNVVQDTWDDFKQRLNTSEFTQAWFTLTAISAHYKNHMVKQTAWSV